MGSAAARQADVHPGAGRPPARPLPDVRRALGELAGREQHRALHPGAGGAQPRLRAGEHRLPRLPDAGVQPARGRPVRVVGGAARQAVRRQPVRAGRAAGVRAAEGRLPGADPHPVAARPARSGQVRRGARPAGVVQPAAERDRARLPARAAVPGRVRPPAASDRDRAARVVPAAAREARDSGGDRAALRRASGPVADRDEGPRGDRRLGPVGADQRLPAGRAGAPGDGVRGVPRAGRGAALRHPGVPAAERAHRRRGAQDPAAGRPVRDELRRRQDRDPRRSAGRRVRAGLRGDGRGAAAVHERAGRAPGERDERERVPHQGEPDAWPLGRVRDAPARGGRQAGAGRGRRQHRDGRRPHRLPVGRRRHDRLPPHPGRHALPR